MFKTNFSERNIICGAQTIFGGQCPEFSPWQRSCAGAVELARFIPDPMPQLLIQAAQTLSMFGSAYLCEQMFSLMKLNKTSHKIHLADEHVHLILRVSSAQALTPNIDELVHKMRHQVSGSDQWASASSRQSFEVSSQDISFSLKDIIFGCFPDFLPLSPAQATF